jgi:hypothetical protein
LSSAYARLTGFLRDLFGVDVSGGGLSETQHAVSIVVGTGIGVAYNEITKAATLSATGAGSSGLSINYAGTEVASGVNRLVATQTQAAQLFPVPGSPTRVYVYVPVLPQARNSFRVEISLSASPTVDAISSDIGTTNESTSSSLTASNVTCTRTATGVYELRYPIALVAGITTMPMISPSCSSTAVFAQIAQWSTDGANRVVTIHTRDHTNALANISCGVVVWVFG